MEDRERDKFSYHECFHPSEHSTSLDYAVSTALPSFTSPQGAREEENQKWTKKERRKDETMYRRLRQSSEVGARRESRMACLGEEKHKSSQKHQLHESQSSPHIQRAIKKARSRLTIKLSRAHRISKHLYRSMSPKTLTGQAGIVVEERR